MLVSAYWSIAELARLHYPLLPSFLLRYPMMTFKDIGRIDKRVLLIHGDQDRLIPFEHSERLHRRHAMCDRQLRRGDAYSR